MAKIMQ